MVKKLISNKEIQSPLYYKYSEHKIKRFLIDRKTLKVVKQLKQHGYKAYVVGGCLRDILLKRKPKDFDVATDAYPEQVKKVFPRAIIIGRRFKLVHIHDTGSIIEVSTFRSGKPSLWQSIKVFFTSSSNKYHRENIFGTMAEDANRRDITINSLYYDPDTQEIIDYTGGYKDVKNKIARVIGKASKRFVEDPMRMIRALRFCAKLELTLDAEAEAGIVKYSKEISGLPSARLFDEFTKLFLTGHAYESYKWLGQYKIIRRIILYSDWGRTTVKEEKMLEYALKSTDKRYNNNQSLAPVFLLTVFLWLPYCKEMEEISKGPLRKHKFNSRHKFACGNTAAKQKERMPIPIKFFWRIEKIWLLQNQMLHYKTLKAEKITENKNFRIAYDFLEARAAGDPKLQVVYSWWTKYIKDNPINTQAPTAGKNKRQSNRHVKQRLESNKKSKKPFNQPAHAV